MNIESPVFIFLCKWTVLLALGWTAHGLLRSRDARWRLILWRSVLCFGLALPLLNFSRCRQFRFRWIKSPRWFRTQ